MSIFKSQKAKKRKKIETEGLKPIKAAESVKYPPKQITKAPAENPDTVEVEGNINIDGSSRTSSGEPKSPTTEPATASAKAPATTDDTHSSSPSFPDRLATESAYTSGPKPSAMSEPTTTIPALYATTALETYETTNDDVYRPEEIIINDVVHRRVDAQYFAYLLDKMEKATKSYQDGHIEGKELAFALAKFVKIERWVLENVGEKGITGAIAERKNGSGYRPEYARRLSVVPEPSEPREPDHLFPADGPWRFTHPVDQDSIDMVDRVRYLAMALGWTEAALYQNRGMFGFPMGPGWGLVCFVKGRRIGTINREEIEIVGKPPRESSLYFRKPINSPDRLNN